MIQNFKNLGEKLKKGSGPEYLIMYVILLTVSATTISILLFFRKEAETKYLAQQIHSGLVFDRKWLNRYAEIGQYSSTEEEFEETILSLLTHTRGLAEEYGDNLFIGYLLKDDRYIVTHHLDLDENDIFTDKTLINKEEMNIMGEIIPAGAAILLNDNNLYYVTEDDNLEIIKEFDFYSHQIYFYDNNLNYNKNIDNIANNQQKELFNYIEYPNLREREVYFLPKLNLTTYEDVEYIDYFDPQKTLYDLFESIEPKLFDTSKRYVLERERTKEMIEFILEDYNTEMNYESKAYTIEFSEGYDFVDLLYDGEEITEKKEALLKKLKKNNKSFFFYGQYENGKMENYGYRIRDYRDVEGNDMYYSYISNSVRLVLNTKIYLPIFNITKEVRFGYDLILEKVDRSAVSGN